MNKDTRQKMAHYREKVSKEYKEKLNNLSEDNKVLRYRLNKQIQENTKLKDKVSQLEDTIRQMTDWVERMQEYTNMTDEQLESVKKQLAEGRLSLKYIEELHRIVGPIAEKLFFG